VDLRALVEASGVLGQLAPARDAEPFGPLLALAVLQVLQKSATRVSRPLDRSRPSSGLLVIQEREIAAQDEILQIFYTYTSDGGPE
jgi:hypothetical protein